MRYVAAVAMLFAVQFALADDCNLSQFPDFWADAQDQVERLSAALSAAEKITPYATKTSKSFKQSISVCSDRRKSVFAGAASGSAGALSQAKCEAAFICTRLSALGIESSP
jgi:hypothetical protein